MRRGAIAIVAVVLGVAGAAALAADRPARTVLAPPARALPITAVPAAVVCPGPETLVVPAGGDAVPPANPVGVRAAAWAVPPGQAATDLPPPGTALATMGALGGEQAPLRTPKGAGARAGAGVVLGVMPRTTGGAVALQPARLPGGDVAAAAVQLGVTRSGDLRGLVAAGCSAATDEAWLAGGGTGTGARARLLLANPAGSPAVVDVTVHGPQGPVRPPAGQGVVVPGRGQIAVYLDALAPGLDRIAVKVAARTGRVLPVLQDVQVNGMVPGGVDDVTPAAPPARRQVLPGVVAAAPGTARVRLVAPQDVDAVVQVHLIGSRGSVDLPKAVVTVPAGAVRDVAFDAAPDGLYTALVASDVPVVAGAVSSRTLPGGELAGTPAGLGRSVPPTDRAWTASSSPLRPSSVLAVPVLPADAPAARGLTSPLSVVLTLAAPEGAARARLVEVSAAGAAAAQRVVEVPAGSVTNVLLTRGTGAVRLQVAPAGAGDAGAPVHAALVLQAADPAGPMIAVAAVPPGPVAGPQAPVAVADRAVGLR